MGAIIIIASLICSGSASAVLTAKANHDHITVDFFYHGSTVGVTGLTEPGTDIIVKIASPEGHQALRKKGKVGGVLWMNVGNLDLEKVPALYFVRATRKVEELLGESEQDRAVIGYAALGRHAEVKPAEDGTEKARWFDEFVRYKEADRLYHSTSGNITVADSEGKTKYYTLFDWPYQALPGDYTVTVYAVRDGRITETAETNVKVEQVGLVRNLARMARDKAALYGAISILAALGAGFGVGLIFRKGGGAH